MSRLFPLFLLTTLGCAHLAPDDEFGTIDRSPSFVATSTPDAGDVEVELSGGMLFPDLALTRATGKIGATPRLELAVDFFPWIASRQDGVWNNGPGDTFLSATYRFLDEAPGRPSFAVNGGVGLSTGRNVIDSNLGGIEGFVGLVTNKQFEHLQGSLFAEAIFSEGSEGSDHLNSGLFGAVAGTSLTRGVAVLGLVDLLVAPDLDAEEWGGELGLLLTPWQPLQIEAGMRTLLLAGRLDPAAFVDLTLYL